MRLLCVLAGGPDHPSSRFRILQHADALRARGIEVGTFVAKRRGPAAIAGLVARARSVDVILIQKKLFAAWKLRMFFGSRPILFDMDDAYFASRAPPGGRPAARGAWIGSSDSAAGRSSETGSWPRTPPAARGTRWCCRPRSICGRFRRAPCARRAPDAAPRPTAVASAGSAAARACAISE